jgi:hypothetical protein
MRVVPAGLVILSAARPGTHVPGYELSSCGLIADSRELETELLRLKLETETVLRLKLETETVFETETRN